MVNIAPHRPHTIWMLWSQGWDDAPKVALSSLASWKDNNPGWTVRALNKQSALEVFGSDIPDTLLREDLPIEAYSDVLRIELLARFGGLWVDATTICAKPLNQWLPEYGYNRDFFAFSQPGPDRMIASWFLYAPAQGYMITRLRDLMRNYWQNRSKRDDYYWLHKLFEQATLSDPEFRKLWETAPHIPAKQPFHFWSQSLRLSQPPTEADWITLKSGQWPVFKLTHKILIPDPENTLFEVLQNYASSRKPTP